MKSYIGFGTPEQFLRETDSTQPININVGRKSGKAGKYGLAIDQTILMMSQARASGPQGLVVEVVYFQAVVDRYQVHHGQIFDTRIDHQAIADQVLKATQLWLKAQGALYREGLLAVPANLMTLLGEVTYLKYTPETGYQYTGPSDQPEGYDGLLSPDYQPGGGPG